MNKGSDGNMRPTMEKGLRRRDWILVLAILFLTPCLLGAVLEFTARHFFYRLPYSGENCLLVQDPLKGAHGIPNCTVEEKVPDGVITSYRFNKNGYRDDAAFGPKQRGVYRIVLIGTSVAGGFRVPIEQTIGTLLAQQLTERTRQRTEVLSEGLPWRSAQAVLLNLDDALATGPDMIVWIISPLDITYSALMAKANVAGGTASERVEAPVRGNWRARTDIFSGNSFTTSLAILFSHTATAVMLRDLFYSSPSQYVGAALGRGGDDQDFMRAQPTAEWQKEYAGFAENVTSIATRTKDAGIPLVAVLVPDRTQAAMISMMSEKPEGFDPYRLGRSLRDTVMRSGGTYVDILPDFQTVPDPQLGFYPLDGHPNAEGHAIITRFLAVKLANLIGHPANGLVSTAGMIPDASR